MQLDKSNSSLSPVAYGDIVLSINTHNTDHCMDPRIFYRIFIIALTINNIRGVVPWGRFALSEHYRVKS